MIELGTIALHGRPSIIAARTRIRNLAMALGLDAAAATRIGIAASETSRALTRHAEEPRIRIGLLEGGSGRELELAFEGWSAPPSTGTLARFFDTVSVHQDGAIRLLAHLRLRASGIEVNDAFIAQQRERLQQRSRDELMREITAQNTELERHRNQLEDIVEERTSELRVAQEQAEQANQAKSQFLSSMSHELRTPLNGVLGYTQILQQDDRITREQRDSLDAIENCGRHLLTLINDVLDLSKIEAGRMEMRIGPTDLEKLVQSVFDIVRPRAESAGLDFELEAAPGLPQGILTDSTKLKQVLVNLLGNSVKFTDSGSVALRAAAVDGRLIFEVEDTGIGMTPDEVAHIFDPFRQAEGGMKSGGTGLGLAISKRIVEALGGEVEVQSAKGRGSLFTVRLPYEEAALEGVELTEDLSLSGAWDLELAPGQDVSILVADDNAMNRDILVQMLERVGFRTFQAADGLEAIEKLRSERPSLVLMDIRMPRMDGIEAAKAIRDDPQLAGSKVVAVTADVLEERRQEIMAAGFGDFLRKPVRAVEVFRCLERQLGVVYVEPEGGAAEAPAEEAAPAAPHADLPEAQAAEFAGRIGEAVAMGDVEVLAGIAVELSEAGAGALGEELDRLARNFELDGIEKLAAQLAPGGS